MTTLAEPIHTIATATTAARGRPHRRIFDTVARRLTPADPRLHWSLGPDGLPALGFGPGEYCADRY